MKHRCSLGVCRNSAAGICRAGHAAGQPVQEACSPFTANTHIPCCRTRLSVVSSIIQNGELVRSRICEESERKPCGRCDARRSLMTATSDGSLRRQPSRRSSNRLRQVQSPAGQTSSPRTRSGDYQTSWENFSAKMRCQTRLSVTRRVRYVHPIPRLNRVEHIRPCSW